MIQITDPDLMINNSFKNFHAKGLDYVCIKRSPSYTLKVYLMDGDASKLPEVVNPHDHRYSFKTTVLAGEMVDYRFDQSEDEGELYNAFDYRTPINGGEGFAHRGVERLKQSVSNVLCKGSTLVTSHKRLHTIGMKSDQTVLMLEQFEDKVPLDVATSCWSPVGKAEPNNENSGLYERFTEEELFGRVDLINRLIQGRSI